MYSRDTISRSCDDSIVFSEINPTSSSPESQLPSANHFWYSSRHVSAKFYIQSLSVRIHVLHQFSKYFQSPEIPTLVCDGGGLFVHRENQLNVRKPQDHRLAGKALVFVLLNATRECRPKELDSFADQCFVQNPLFALGADEDFDGGVGGEVHVEVRRPDRLAGLSVDTMSRCLLTNEIGFEARLSKISRGHTKELYKIIQKD